MNDCVLFMSFERKVFSHFWLSQLPILHVCQVFWQNIKLVSPYFYLLDFGVVQRIVFLKAKIIIEREI